MPNLTHDTNHAGGSGQRMHPGEESPLEPVATSRGYRRFAILSLAGILTTLTIVVGCNVWADPFGIVGVGRYHLASREWLDRTDRAQRLGELRKPPEVLVLGSSTSEALRPRDIEDVSGRHAFLAAVSNGRPIDAFAFASYAHERFGDRSPHIVWGLDVDSMQDALPNPATVVHTPELRRQFERRDQARFMIESVQPLVDLRRLELSFRVVRRGPGPRRPDINSAYNDDGEAKDYDAVDADEFRRRVHLPPLNTRLIGRYERLDEDEVRFLRATVDRAVSWGDRPVLVLPPVRPAARAELERGQWGDRRRDLLAQLALLDDRIRLIDATDVDAWSGDPEGFLDDFHLDAANSRRLVVWLDKMGAFEAR